MITISLSLSLSHLPISKEEPLSLDVNRGQVGDLDIYSHMAFWLRSSGGSDGKRLSTMRETWVRSLGQKVIWRRKWQPTPVFLPRESQGWGSLVGCRLWGLTESDTTEAT